MSEEMFHADELLAHARAGVRTPRAAIRDFLTDQHRLFFEDLSYVVVAAGDDERLSTTLLTGPPGFVSAPNDKQLRITLGAPEGAAWRRNLAIGQPIGVLGIDLSTRRRNRCNGEIAAVHDGWVIIDVKQSFGNCAKYIQRRAARPILRAASQTQSFVKIDAKAAELIASADTFFIASRSRPDVGQNGGVDVSHRGGRPGFIRIQGDGLIVPDFPGNRYFNTIGNLLNAPLANLLFVDFENGDLLSLRARARMDWDNEERFDFVGAERFCRFEILGGERRSGAVPLSFSFMDYAPTTEVTGVWN